MEEEKPPRRVEVTHASLDRDGGISLGYRVGPPERPIILRKGTVIDHSTGEVLDLDFRSRDLHPRVEWLTVAEDLPLVEVAPGVHLNEPLSPLTRSALLYAFRELERCPERCGSGVCWLARPCPIHEEETRGGR